MNPYPPIITEVFGLKPELERLSETLYRVENQWAIRPRGGRLAFALTGPTGSGKDTVRDLLPEESFFPFKTVTSRPRRDNEPEASDPYYRLSLEEFLAAKNQGEFFETNNFAGHWYGGRHTDVKGLFDQGLIPVFRPDPQGAANYLFMAEAQTPPFADVELIVVFLLPAKKEHLGQRLYQRDVAPYLNEADIQVRQAKYQDRLKIAEAEIHRAHEAHYVVINDHNRPEVAARQFSTILKLHR